MPGLVKEEAKKELEGLLEQGKSSIQKQQESLLTPEQKKEREEKKAQDAKDAETKRLEVEKQAKADAELLSKKDEEIKDEAEKNARPNCWKRKKRKKKPNCPQRTGLRTSNPRLKSALMSLRTS
jgi:hypothetical protein